MATDIVPILEDPTGDVEVILDSIDTNFYVGRDLRVTPITVTRPTKSTGAFFGKRIVRANSVGSVTLDLAYNGASAGPLIFNSPNPANLILGGVHYLGGYPTLWQPDIDLFYGTVDMDSFTYWSHQATTLNTYTVNVQKLNSNDYLITRLTGPSFTSGLVGLYCQIWGAGLGGSNNKCGTVATFVDGDHIHCNKNSSENDGNTTNNVTAYIGTSPTGGTPLYNNSQGIDVANPNAIRIGVYGLDMNDMNVAVRLEWTGGGPSDVTVQGCRMRTKQPLYDPTDSEHSNSITGERGHGSLNTRILDSYLLNRLLLDDYNLAGDAAKRGHIGLELGRLWIDGAFNKAFVLFASGAAPPVGSATRGVFGQMHDIVAYTGAAGAVYRNDNIRNDSTGVFALDSTAPWNQTPSRINVTETNVVYTGTPPATDMYADLASPALLWRNRVGQRYADLHTFYGFGSGPGGGGSAPKVGASLGDLAWQTATSGNQNTMTAALGPQGDGSLNHIRIELVPSSYIGVTGGALDSALASIFDKYYTRGVRNFLILFNNRGNAWGAYANDGDYDDGTHYTQVETLSQNVAASLASMYPLATRAYELGNEVPGAVDGAGRHNIGKYANQAFHVRNGLKLGDPKCLVGTGSTLLFEGTNIPTGQTGSNIYGGPTGASASHRSWSQADWYRDFLFNTGNVLAFDGSAYTLAIHKLQDIGFDFICVHPYCTIGGPNSPGVVGGDYTTIGTVNRFIIENAWRELPFIAKALDDAGLKIKMWATEVGHATAPSWPAAGGITVPTGTVMFPDQGTPTSDHKNWNRPILYIANTTANTKPGTSSQWNPYSNAGWQSGVSYALNAIVQSAGHTWRATSAHTSSGGNAPGAGGAPWQDLGVVYDGGENTNTIATENEAGQHTLNMLRQWTGLDNTVDNGTAGTPKNIGPYTGPYLTYLPADHVIGTSPGYTYGLKYGTAGPWVGSGVPLLSDKGQPTSSGPFQVLKSFAAFDDPRMSSTSPPPPEDPVARKRYNNKNGVLSAQLVSGATTMQSSQLSTLPTVVAPDYAVIALDPDKLAGEPELAWVTDHPNGSTTATITRAQEGTNARTHAIGIKWEHVATAADFETELVDGITVETALGRIRIKDGSITSAKIANNAVDYSKFQVDIGRWFANVDGVRFLYTGTAREGDRYISTDINKEYRYDGAAWTQVWPITSASMGPDAVSTFFVTENLVDDASSDTPISTSSTSIATGTIHLPAGWASMLVIISGFAQAQFQWSNNATGAIARAVLQLEVPTGTILGRPRSTGFYDPGTGAVNLPDAVPFDMPPVTLSADTAWKLAGTEDQGDTGAVHVATRRLDALKIRMS